MSAATIYKLITQEEWEGARAEGVFRGSAHDRRDGFIHFSTAAQLAGTAVKHFFGVPDLVVLAIDVEMLERLPHPDPLPQGERERARACNSVPSPLAGEGQDEGKGPLRWEPSRGGDLFPHLYAHLPMAAVQEAMPIALADDGTPIIPDGLPS